MNSSFFVGLLNNIALLLSAGILYDFTESKTININPLIKKILTGLSLGIIGVAIMLSPWEFSEGVVFDGRSILLSISGLFFGVLPTLITMLLTVFYRYFIGGVGVWAGISVIFMSGFVGIGWRYFVDKKHKKITLWDVFLIGILVNILMLLCMFILPYPISILVLAKISIPAMFVYPIGTLFIGMLLIRRRDRKQNENHFQIITNSAPDSIITMDENGKIIFANQSARILFGYHAKKMTGKYMDDFVPERYRKQHQESINVLKNGSPPKINGGIAEMHGLRNDGSEFPITLSFSRWKSDNKRFYTGIIRDISEQKNKENKLMHLATHDGLTNLPNRTLFLDRLDHALTIAKRNQKTLAVIYVDIDDFKTINDAFGHEKGDMFMKHVVRCLESNLRESDTAARLGGDEFAILLENIQHQAVIPLIQKIMKSIEKPVIIDHVEITSTVSAGIGMFPNDGEDSAVILQNADMAMYNIKKNGKNRYQFFSPEMNYHALEQLQTISDLRQAIPNNEFVLHYQPLIDAITGSIIGTEALIRWNHPTRGLLFPGEFLDIVETGGMGGKLGDWVLDNACQQLATWVKNGNQSMRMAVNVSSSQLRSGRLSKTIKRYLSKYGLAPNLLELELSENILFKDLQKAIPVLNNIRNLGVRISIDDFGTGYSSLSHLSSFHFDALKIDQYFAKAVISSYQDEAIVKGIVSIAKNLKIDIISEGVETIEQLNFFKDLGCNIIQGYYFYKGLPASEIESLLPSAEKLVKSNFTIR
jgi:diguanylate cyclase